MNNEPVAWMRLTGDRVTRITLEKVQDNDIPLYTHPAEPKELTVPENSQDWKGMDGATAFWLIERHSNHWDDARLMMEEWLKANTHPAKHLSLQKVDGELVALTYTNDEHRIIEVLWEKPPAKTLTDEEIAVIWANYSVPMTGMEFKKVVEAILRKAQEK